LICTVAHFYHFSPVELWEMYVDDLLFWYEGIEDIMEDYPNG